MRDDVRIIEEAFDIAVKSLKQDRRFGKAAEFEKSKKEIVARLRGKEETCRKENQLRIIS